MKDDVIPIELLPYFLEIANRLWSGHATVMVGAGFSKNALSSNSIKKHFPNWNQLGDIFYQKAYGKIPTDQCYLNVLKLAEEVEATFGRPVLDQMLRDEIPDKDHQPSILHEKLLRLPWTDIFTTNYDTLLERASENVTSQRFDIVTNKDDLVYSKKPRIIKLHGSFPSKRPFIITEEDYRQYPKKFAPFVNTVQQSLIENTLCLIGFSGDDPNFLKWVGWIHDNLGKENSPKIYLIGILKLSIGQIKLLERRNITTLDLSNCKDVKGNHEKAFTIFLDYLSNEGKLRNRLGWPDINLHFFFDREKEVMPQLTPILENWRMLRQKYPNWIIVPEDRREVLKIYTEDSISFIYQLSKVDTPIDIQFLYEYNWRIEKCLLPISNDVIKYYESIIEKYNPFPTLIDIENSITPNNEQYKILDWKDIGPKWLEIQLSLMRVYREEGIHSQWQKVSIRLKTIFKYLKPEFQERYYYERCLYSMFSLNITEAKKELEEWLPNDTLPFWEAKRAGLMAELGDVVEAEKILEDSLKFIRKELNLNPIINDYSYVSQEAYVMQLLNYIKQAASFNKKRNLLSKEDGSSFKDRWEVLVQYKCDPWAEINLFKISLDREPVEIRDKVTKYGFDIGQISNTYNLSGYDKYAAHAYSYLRFVEEIGIPYHLPWMTFGKESAKGAIKHIAKYSPYWAFATLVRIGDSELSNSIFDRKSISKMDSEQIDNLISRYLSVLENSKLEIKNSDSFQNSNFASSLSSVLPEILSRLCVKSSYDIKLKLINFLRDVYSSNFRDRYRGIGDLTKRLINSFCESDQYKLIPVFLEFQVLPELNHLIDKEYLDPFSYIEIDKEIVNKTSKIKIGNEKIKELFDYTKKSTREKQNALRRLIYLWKLDLLTKKQIELLANSLWHNIDSNTGFPSDSIYLLYSYLILPHPKNINPEKLLKAYLAASLFPIQAHKTDKGVPMTGGYIPIFQEITGTSNSEAKYFWSKSDISLLLKKLIEWWDADKKYLEVVDKPDAFGSIPNEFKARFSNLISIFTDILFPNDRLMEESEKDEVLRVIYEFERYKMINLAAKASFYHLLPNDQEEISRNIYESLFSKEREKVIDALNGFKTLLESSNDSAEVLLSVVTEHIRSRNETALSSFIKLISFIIKRYPKLITSRILADLKLGLTYLQKETQILSDDTPEDVDNKLSIKEEAASLTVVLKNYYSTKKIKVPEYINSWGKLCLDKNEFSEIRRIWEDA